jgi:hypothetical protein
VETVFGRSLDSDRSLVLLGRFWCANSSFCDLGLQQQRREIMVFTSFLTLSWFLGSRIIPGGTGNKIE